MNYKFKIGDKVETLTTYDDTGQIVQVCEEGVIEDILQSEKYSSFKLYDVVNKIGKHTVYNSEQIRPCSDERPDTYQVDGSTLLLLSKVEDGRGWSTFVDETRIAYDDRIIEFYQKNRDKPLKELLEYMSSIGYWAEAEELEYSVGFYLKRPMREYLFIEYLDADYYGFISECHGKEQLTVIMHQELDEDVVWLI